MCDKCAELETQIEHFRQFVTAGLDGLTIERIQELIQEMEKRIESCIDRVARSQ